MNEASNNTYAEVMAILGHAGVNYNVAYKGEKTEASGRGHVVDEWSSTFTVANGRTARPPEAREEFDYFTGLGCRKVPTWKYGVQGYDNGPPPWPGTLLHEQWMKQAKPQTPHAADVLCSLILDSSAVGQSFESWCDDFGFDTDSRKAFNTYAACQQNADKLARIFNAAQMEALRNALQDY